MIEARNQADSLTYQVEKDLKQNGSRLNPGDRQRIDAAISALRTAITGEDVSAIQQRIATLTQAAQRIAEAMQQANQPGPQSAGGPAAAPGGRDDNVVDAEFEEVNENNRRAS